jgi:hypothetical protein
MAVTLSGRSRARRVEDEPGHVVVRDHSPLLALERAELDLTGAVIDPRRLGERHRAERRWVREIVREDRNGGRRRQAGRAGEKARSGDERDEHDRDDPGQPRAWRRRPSSAGPIEGGGAMVASRHATPAALRARRGRVHTLVHQAILRDRP